MENINIMSVMSGLDLVNSIIPKTKEVVGIQPRFDYHKIIRGTDETSGLRIYKTPDNKSLPSVTTIIDYTTDKPFIDAWVRRVGAAEAKRVSEEATTLGTATHSYLESYFTGTDPIRPSNIPDDHWILASKMSEIVINRSLTRITRVLGLEVGLYFPNLYAGTADFIGEIDDEIFIGDFKTTKKIRGESVLESYGPQLAAYAIAHNCVYGTNIKSGRIFMVARDLSYVEYNIQGDKWNKYVSEWLRMVERYMHTYHK